MAETWLGAFGVRRRQPDVQRKKTGLHAKAKQRQPEQRREFRMIAHRAEIPTAGARRQRGEKCKQPHRARVRRYQIKPAGRAHAAPLTVQRDQKKSAEREDFPRHQKMQAVGNRQHQSHAQHERAPPPSAAARGGADLARPASIHGHKSRRLRPPPPPAPKTRRSSHPAGNAAIRRRPENRFASPNCRRPRARATPRTIRPTPRQRSTPATCAANGRRRRHRQPTTNSPTTKAIQYSSQNFPNLKSAEPFKTAHSDVAQPSRLRV